MNAKQLRKLFDDIDTTGNGRVTLIETRGHLKKVGFHATRNQAEAFIRQADTENKGYLDFNSFSQFILHKRQSTREIFDAIDVSGDGRICHYEVMEALHGHGLPVAEDVIHVIMDKIDQSGDKQIDFVEFEVFLACLPQLTPEEMFDMFHDNVLIDNGDDMSFAPPGDYLAGGTRRPFQQIIAACLSGLVARSFTAPLDRIKIILQTQAFIDRRSISTLFKDIFHDEGMKGMFRGNGANALKLLGEGFTRFFCYDRFQATIEEIQLRTLAAHQKFAAGAAAGLVTCTVTYPLETVRVRLATTAPTQYDGVLSTLAKITQEEGWKTLFRGLGPSLLAFIPYASIDLAVFDILRTAWVEFEGNKFPSPFVLLVCGGTSATVGQAVSYPITLVRTKLQVDGNYTGHDTRQYRGMFDCIKQVWNEQGFKGFFRGFGVNLIKSVPSIAVSHAVADNVRKVLTSS
eukprot:TRINITY_DN4050_c0_g1_i1.p1 TRINITY_DN4050_c0_g1~~TRINITY_DN4050_c0_g1_i1.p1  ORF type:complete len:459 (-),score=79.50 TRINITY_DN4050_c0_g1_i1:236-1612(-)